jgi:hypothetical protein
MALVVFTLEVAGTEKPFASWNALDPVLVQRSLDEDELGFTLKGDIRSACPMSYGQAVKVRRNGVCVFIGTITSVRAIGTRNNSAWIVGCSNAWFQLARTMFQQSMTVYTSPGCARQAVSTTKVVLYSDPTTGASITTGQQIQNVCTAAISAGISIAAGTLPSFITVPFETVRELTMADVIRQCLQWTPDAVSWFDYSSGVAVLNCQQRSLLSSTSFDCEADPAIVASIDLQSREDLVPSGVRFNYLGIQSCPPGTLPGGCPTPATDSALQVTTLTQDDSGIVTTAGALIGTVDLAQLTDTTTEAPPTGLAGEYYTSLLTVQWQGTVVTREKECSLSAHPGLVLNLTNGNSDWTTMNAVVQQVGANLTTGETTITLGPPSHLMPQTFVNLIQLTRRRALVANAFAATRPPGDGGTPNCVAGVDPSAQQALNNAKGNAAQMTDNLNKGSSGSQTNLQNNTFPAGIANKEIDVCVDGVATTITVYGPP